MMLPYVVDGDGAGPKLVYAHGLSGTGAWQRMHLLPLVDAGWTVVTFDQRGHGASPPLTDPSGYDSDAMGADLWDVADAAGFDRCWIGGGSMGAATSWCAARSRPERVQGLIQAVPALWSRPHRLVHFFDTLADAVRDGGIPGLVGLLCRLADEGGRRGADPIYLEQLRAHDPASLECAFRSVARWVLPDVPSGFVDLPFPVLVVGWKGDEIHPIELAREIAITAGTDCLLLDADEVLDEPSRFGRALVDVLVAA